MSRKRKLDRPEDKPNAPEKLKKGPIGQQEAERLLGIACNGPSMKINGVPTTIEGVQGAINRIIRGGGNVQSVQRDERKKMKRLNVDVVRAIRQATANGPIATREEFLAGLDVALAGEDLDESPRKAASGSVLHTHLKAVDRGLHPAVNNMYFEIIRREVLRRLPSAGDGNGDAGPGGDRPPPPKSEALRLWESDPDRREACVKELVASTYVRHFEDLRHQLRAVEESEDAAMPVITDNECIEDGDFIALKRLCDTVKHYVALMGQEARQSANWRTIRKKIMDRWNDAARRSGVRDPVVGDKQKVACSSRTELLGLFEELRSSCHEKLSRTELEQVLQAEGATCFITDDVTEEETTVRIFLPNTARILMNSDNEREPWLFNEEEEEYLRGRYVHLRGRSAHSKKTHLDRNLRVTLAREVSQRFRGGIDGLITEEDIAGLCGKFAEEMPEVKNPEEVMMAACGQIHSHLLRKILEKVFQKIRVDRGEEKWIEEPKTSQNYPVLHQDDFNCGRLIVDLQQVIDATVSDVVGEPRAASVHAAFIDEGNDTYNTIVKAVMRCVGGVLGKYGISADDLRNYVEYEAWEFVEEAIKPGHEDLSEMLPQQNTMEVVANTDNLLFGRNTEFGLLTCELEDLQDLCESINRELVLQGNASARVETLLDASVLEAWASELNKCYHANLDIRSTESLIDDVLDIFTRIVAAKEDSGNDDQGSALPPAGSGGDGDSAGASDTLLDETRDQHITLLDAEHEQLMADITDVLAWFDTIPEPPDSTRGKVNIPSRAFLNPIANGLRRYQEALAKENGCHNPPLTTDTAELYVNLLKTYRDEEIIMVVNGKLKDAKRDQLDRASKAVNRVLARGPNLRVDDLSVEVESAIRSYAAAKRKIVECDAIIADRANATAALDRAKSRSEELVQESEALRAQIEAAKRFIDETTSRVCDLPNEVTTLITSIKSAGVTIREKQADLEMASANVDRLIDALAQERSGNNSREVIKRLSNEFHQAETGLEFVEESMRSIGMQPGETEDELIDVVLTASKELVEDGLEDVAKVQTGADYRKTKEQVAEFSGFCSELRENRDVHESASKQFGVVNEQIMSIESTQSELSVQLANMDLAEQEREKAITLVKRIEHVNSEFA